MSILTFLIKLRDYIMFVLAVLVIGLCVIVYIQYKYIIEIKEKTVKIKEELSKQIDDLQVELTELNNLTATQQQIIEFYNELPVELNKIAQKNEDINREVDNLIEQYKTFKNTGTQEEQQTVNNKLIKTYNKILEDFNAGNNSSRRETSSTNENKD